MNSDVMTPIEYAHIEDGITSVSRHALIELFAIVIDDPMVDLRPRCGCDLRDFLLANGEGWSNLAI
jgi:hypothetical protein